jgi:hypothetical protein
VDVERGEEEEEKNDFGIQLKYHFNVLHPFLNLDFNPKDDGLTDAALVLQQGPLYIGDCHHLLR